MLIAADGGQMSALCLLDLFAAFDMVDHDLLMLWMDSQCGLKWCAPVVQLMPVWQNVSRIYGGSTSSVVYIPCSVLQITSRNVASVSTHLLMTCNCT